MVAVGGWLLMRPSGAPIHAPDTGGSTAGHITGDSTDLAVLDGNTLRVGTAVVRLAGIAAPARGTICHGDRLMEFDCGSAAANALAALVRDAEVDCTIRGHDRLGRPVGDCLAGGRKLSQTLVQQGWARATTADLHAPEADARSAQRGIWRSTDRS